MGSDPFKVALNDSLPVVAFISSARFLSVSSCDKSLLRRSYLDQIRFIGYQPLGLIAMEDSRDNHHGDFIRAPYDGCTKALKRHRVLRFSSRQSTAGVVLGFLSSNSNYQC